MVTYVLCRYMANTVCKNWKVVKVELLPICFPLQFDEFSAIQEISQRLTSGRKRKLHPNRCQYPLINYLRGGCWAQSGSYCGRTVSKSKWFIFLSRWRLAGRTIKIVCQIIWNTGKSLSEALLFAEHGGEHVVYRNCSENEKQFEYITFCELAIFM